MMHLGTFVTAHFAWTTDELPTAQIHVGVGPTVGLGFCFWVQLPVLWTILPHVSSMARAAIALRLTVPGLSTF